MLICSMKHTALDVINEEHLALAAMLRSLSTMLKQARRDGQLPDFEVVRAMLFYVDEFPEQLHHRKESDLLFPKVLQRCPELEPVITRLERDHLVGESAIRMLQHQLLAFEVMGEPRRTEFEQAAEQYTCFYLEHMSLEEQRVLPAARRCLNDADWAELDAAFANNRDPLTGHEVTPDYAPLFRRILMQAPAPIGLGTPRG